VELNIRINEILDWLQIEIDHSIFSYWEKCTVAGIKNSRLYTGHTVEIIEICIVRKK